MLKVIIDTNVFISGILTKDSNPSIVIKAWKRAHKFQLFITEDILREILKVLKRLDVSIDIVTGWDKTIRKNAVKIIPVRKIETIKEDPEDDKFLECAVEANADYIVTGDKHLRKLNKFEDIKIVNPKEFLDILRGKCK